MENTQMTFGVINKLNIRDFTLASGIIYLFIGLIATILQLPMSIGTFFWLILLYLIIGSIYGIIFSFLYNLLAKKTKQGFNGEVDKIGNKLNKIKVSSFIKPSLIIHASIGLFFGLLLGIYFTILYAYLGILTIENLVFTLLLPFEGFFSFAVFGLFWGIIFPLGYNIAIIKLGLQIKIDVRK